MSTSGQNNGLCDKYMDYIPLRSTIPCIAINHSIISLYSLAWEKSWHLAKPPLVSPRNDVWEMSAELPYNAHLGSASDWSIVPQKHCFNQSEAQLPSGLWQVSSMEFLQSFLRHHFAEKLVIASRNGDCFLRLIILSPSKFLIQWN